MASLAHTFSGFMVGWGQHYFFATAFAEFTMLMWGFELYQQEGGDDDPVGLCLIYIYVNMYLQYSMYM